MVFVSDMQALAKGKFHISFDNGISCQIYRTEAKTFRLEVGRELTDDEFSSLMKDYIGKRVKKRAMHLLEQMDRSEAKLREKLNASDYPEECVNEAISYVKSFHYLDDERYAATYVRYHGHKMSRQQMTLKLQEKGIDRKTAMKAIEEEYQGDELTQIRELLEKKHFDYSNADEKERRRIYSFLMRRGFSSNDVLKVMKESEIEYFC